MFNSAHIVTVSDNDQSEINETPTHIARVQLNVFNSRLKLEDIKPEVRDKIVEIIMDDDSMFDMPIVALPKLEDLTCRPELVLVPEDILSHMTETALANHAHIADYGDAQQAVESMILALAYHKITGQTS